MSTKNKTAREIITFLIITTGISSGIFIWMFSGAEDSLAAVLPMMYTPGISAVLTMLIFKGRMRDLGWKLGKARFLAYAFFLPILVSLIGYGIIWLTDYSDFTTAEVVNYRWAKMIGFDLPAPFIVGLLSKALIATLLTILPVFGEEVGWSGFLTPKLRQFFSIPVTSIIVGVYWSVWHFPAIIGGFYGYGTPLWIALPGFTLVLTGASFIRTVLVERSKSLWSGVILHASHNVILMGIFLEMSVRKEYTTHLVSETGLFLGFIYILVAVGFYYVQRNKIIKHKTGLQ